MSSFIIRGSIHYGRWSLILVYLSNYDVVVLFWSSVFLAFVFSNGLGEHTAVGLLNDLQQFFA